MPRPSKPWYREARDHWCTKIDGKTVVLARGKRARADAMKAFHALMADRGDDRPLPTSGTTLAGLADMFLGDAVHRVAPKSYDAYRTRLSIIVRGLGKNTAAESLRPYQVNQWLNARVVRKKGYPDRPLTGTGKRNDITLIKLLYRWGKKEGIIGTNPLAEMALPEENGRRSIMTDDQAEAVIRFFSPELRDLLIFMRETGCRPSEAAAVEASMLIDGRIVMKSKTSRRTRRARIIDLTAAALAVFARNAETRPDGPVFRNRFGNPWTPCAIHYRFLRMREKLGFGPEATAESFRHQFATDALEKGVPIATVAEMMGHTSTKMITKHYSHLIDRPNHFREALAVFRPARAGDGSAASRPDDDSHA